MERITEFYAPYRFFQRQYTRMVLKVVTANFILLVAQILEIFTYRCGVSSFYCYHFFLVLGGRLYALFIPLFVYL